MSNYSSKMTPNKKQIRIALRNCGVINPEIIDEYLETIEEIGPNPFKDM